MPTPPEKRGYTFKGWKVVYDLRGLNPEHHGNSYGYIELSGTSGGTNDYGLTTPGTWGITFDYGKIIGRAFCGIISNDGNPQESDSGSCYCRAIGFDNGTMVQDVIPVSWVRRGFDYDVRPSVKYSNCVNGCSGSCAQMLSIYTSLRRDLFGQSQN